MAHILIVEDHDDINAMIAEKLAQDGHTSDSAYSGTEALRCVASTKYDLVLLDLMLPGLSGEEFLERFRADHATPVIVISAKADTGTKLELFKRLADDYLVKPFDLDELTARITTLLWRTGAAGEAPETSSGYEHRGVRLDPENRIITVEGADPGLTPREFRILELLLTHPKRVFTKREIYEHAWDGAFMDDEKTVTVHVSNLRKKLAALTDAEIIDTVWGVGFRLAPDTDR